MNKLPAETKTIIKTADRMEALWFIQTYGIGRHAAAVIEDMNSKMGAYYEMLSPRVEEAARQVWKEMTTGDIMI
jgi:TRAP-type C4-dicarboxylate transport system substrate-binding protein